MESLLLICFDEALISTILGMMNYECCFFHSLYNGNGCGKWERLRERLQKIIDEKHLVIIEYFITFASSD